MHFSLRNAAKYAVRRVAAKPVVRRIASRVFRDEFSLASDLEAVPLDRLLHHHEAVWRNLHDRLNAEHPHFKLRRGGVCSFTDFVARHINTRDPVRVLDIASGDCYLDFMLAEQMHAETHFDCIDIKRPRRLYQNARITFAEQDVLSILADIPFTRYDYVVLSGFLGLLPDEQTRIVLDAASRCPLLFIRENPGITNLIDAWKQLQPTTRREYPHLFTEQSLKDTLRAHDFEILALEHEYDIYVFAGSRRTPHASS